MISALLQLVAALVAFRLLRPRYISLQLPQADRASIPPTAYRQVRHLAVGTVLLVLGVGLAIWIALRTSEVITLLVVSIVLAVALRPTVDRIGGTRIPTTTRTVPRPLAILLIYLLLAFVAAGIGFLMVPPIVTETQKLIQNLPTLMEQFTDWLRSLSRYPFAPDLSGLPQQITSQLLGSIPQTVSILIFAVNVLTGFLSIGVVLVLTFFLIHDADLIYEHFLSLLTPSQQETMRDATAKMGRKIEGWLKGTLLLAFILGSVTALVMWLLGMPYPLLLGLAAGLFELVPIIGPYLGAAPAGAIALFSEPLWKFIAVVLYFFGIQQIENNLLAPNIFGRQVELPPLLIILALLIGASLNGILGALLAVPVAAVFQVLWTDMVVPAIKRRQSG